MTDIERFSAHVLAEAWRIRDRIGEAPQGVDPIKEKRALYRAAAAYLEWMAARGRHIQESGVGAT